MIITFGNGPEIGDSLNITAVNGTTTTTVDDNTDKSNLVTVIWAVNLTAFVLVGLLVPLRVIVRCTVTRDFFSDDVLVIIAALFTFGICSLLPIATDMGLGQHPWNLLPDFLVDNTRNLRMLIFIANTLYPCAVAFTRLSAICSFLRLIGHRSMRYTMYIAAAFAGLFAFASVFAVIFQCRPVSAAWDLAIVDASCYPFYDFLRASGGINATIDAILLLIPLPYFWKLKTLSLSRKMALTILFVFAGLAFAAAVVKLVYLEPLNQPDVTYNWVSWVLCSIAECTIAIVCISIPPIIPLFTKCSRRKTPRSRGEKSKSLRYTLFANKPTFTRAVAPRVIRPMATPWKDKPLETTNVDFHWLRLEQEQQRVEFGQIWDRPPQSTKANQVLGIAL